MFLDFVSMGDSVSKTRPDAVARFIQSAMVNLSFNQLFTTDLQQASRVAIRRRAWALGLLE